jgi:hypothetical protein
VITTKDLTELVAAWHKDRKRYQDKAYQRRTNEQEAEFFEGISAGYAYALDDLDQLVQRKGGK